jgi:hypothetical protein
MTRSATYAHGVAEETANLPDGWKDRLVRVQNENTGTGVGLCLEAHDLAVSKLIAGREKDVEFIGLMPREKTRRRVRGSNDGPNDGGNRQTCEPPLVILSHNICYISFQCMD